MKKLTLAALVALISGNCAFAGATFTWRIGAWQSDSDFERFLDFAKTHRLTGKISFFTCNCHTPPKLSDLLPTLEVVKRRIAVMKSLGYETGINHLVTLGHVDEGLDVYEDIPEAQRFTGADGRHAVACYCPCDPIWRERYLKKVYQELAKTGADFIWTDDDIRLENHGVKGWGCFCPVCMKRMERIGYVGDREGFGKWLEDPKEGDARRRAYLQLRRETVADLLGFIADTVREVNPAIPVGVMDCGNYDHLPGPEKFAALKGDKYPIYWRPGGGFWNDLAPDEILWKVNSLARECAYIPDGIKCLEGEIESFNYQRLRKSVHFTRLESDAYVAACMPGIAYNVIGGPSTDDLSVAGDLVDALEANRARLEAIGAVTGRKPCRGVYPVFGRDSALGMWKGDGAEWLSINYPHWTAPYQEGDIQKIGLPTAYRPECASVWATDGRGVRSMTDSEIVTMLSTGAYLSYDAVEELIARGFGKDVGFDIVGDASGDEKYVEHPFNTGDVGRIRDVRQSFWGGTIRALKPHEGAETVSCVVSVTGEELAPCVSGCFENGRGGRVFVSGGFAWDRLLWKSKTDQLKRIFRWLSRDALPGYVESFHRVALWVRGDDAIVILNMSADPARDVRLMLKDAGTLEAVGERVAWKVMGEAADGYTRYRLPELAPWSVTVLRRTAKASPSSRVRDLLSRMTLAEKIGQVCQYNSQDGGFGVSTDASASEFSKAFIDRIRAGGVGSLISAPGLENFNMLQKVAVEESRLGVPLMVGHDLIHSAGIVYPIPLAASCSWDADLWRQTADSIARNGRLRGANWTFAPMLDISRDARWGRIAESAGQDPFLASLVAAAQVKGFQGDDLADGTHLAACAKHYIGYGAVESGLEYDKVEMSESTLRDIYLPPFVAAVAAGVATVMPGFHAFNGVPCSMNRWLLTDVLRGELGFEGYCISDYGAVSEIANHGIVSSPTDIAAAAISAGMDQEMTGNSFPNGIARAIEDGKLKSEDLDRAVARVLAVKERLGLFERPYLDRKRLAANVDEEADFALALRAAVESTVLLKNDGVLPFSRNVRVTLVGDIADRPEEMYGCWTQFGEKTRNGSLRQGLEAVGCTVDYAPCYSLTGAVDVAALDKAVAGAELVVAAFGEYADMSGENRSRTDISLGDGQREVIRRIRRGGKPLVAVVFGGRPLAMPELAREANAVVMGWHLGSSAGWGIAKVLVGDEEPYGRLTVDFPYASGECPRYYNRPISGKPFVRGGSEEDNMWRGKYIDVPNEPLYPFGFGLTYTKFSYSNRRVEREGDELVCRVDVTNEGARKGSEVVQAYVRLCEARVTRPRRELKGFERVFLAPGERKTVTIRLPVASLAYPVDGAGLVAPEGEVLVYLSSDSDATAAALHLHLPPPPKF